ncbi:MAG: DUF2993 domain-containing protein [Candidatus Aquicultor sp.]|nr:DUF2993 domain-containing protein [Candidatus Aquicultor sp.]
MKRWCIITTLIIVLGVFFAIIVPTIVSYSIEKTVIETIRRDYDLKDCAYVRVDHSYLELFRGKIERVYIECTKSEFNGIKAKSVVITVKDIEFDVKKTLQTRDAAIRDIGRARASIVVSEAEINKFIARSHDDLKGWRLDLKPNEVVANAEIEMIGKLDVSFRPRLKGDRLVLEPTEAKFAATDSLGLSEAKNWIGEIGLDLPVSDLPFNMKITKVLVQDNQMLVNAGN